MASDIMRDGIPAIIEAADRGRAPDVLDVGEELGITAPMLVRPVAYGGFAVESVKAEIDKYRDRPERRKGTATLTTLDSFIKHTKTFQDGDSAIFICDDPEGPSFSSVLNYHEAVNPQWIDKLPLPATGSNVYVPRPALPRFGDHRGVYTPEFSDEWKLWTGANEKGLEQREFARLIERGARHIFDVSEEPEGKLGELAAWFAKRFGRRFEPSEFFGSSTTMLQLAEGLTANVTETIGETNVRGANRSVTFVSKTSTESVTVPTAILLALPVFRGADRYQVPARLDFTPKPKGDIRVLEWKIELWNPDDTIKACLEDMGETVAKATGLPIFFGAPE